MTYELPFGKGKKWMNHNRLLDALFGGYSFSWNFSVWAPTPREPRLLGRHLSQSGDRRVGARQNYPNYEPDPGSELYLVQIPQLRDNWQDIGTNRFAQNAQNPLVTNCGTTPIIQSNGSDLGQQVRSGRAFVHPRQHAEQLLHRAADHRRQRVDLQGLPDQGTVQGAAPDGLLQSVQVVQLGQR